MGTGGEGGAGGGGGEGHATLRQRHISSSI